MLLGEILLISIGILFPIVLFFYSILKSKQSDTQQLLPIPKKMVFMSVVYYTVSYCILYFINELALVLPKSYYNMDPILYHNNHTWLVDHPLADLLQGTGGATSLVLSCILVLLYSVKTPKNPHLRLFHLWSIYHGFALSIPQFSGILFDAEGTDVVLALRYIGVSTMLGSIIGVLCIFLLLFVGIWLSPKFLSLAPSKEFIETQRQRNHFMLYLVFLPAILGFFTLIPFKIPGIDPVLSVSFASIFPSLWIIGWSFMVKNIDTGIMDTQTNSDDFWIYKIEKFGIISFFLILIIFQIVLAPGIQF